MKTTTNTKAENAILAILRSGEQTEDHVAAACRDRGIYYEDRELAIGALLDAGRIVPTMIQVDGLGIGNRRFIAALRRVG